MTAHLAHGETFTALTVTDISGATLNVERTDDGSLSAWIAPPGGNDGHSVRIDEADLISLVAYMSVGAATAGHGGNATGHRPAYVALVAALRAEFLSTALEALWIQMREHRDNRSSLGVLAQAVHDAHNPAYDAGEAVHPAVRAWFSRNTPKPSEATR